MSNKTETIRNILNLILLGINLSILFAPDLFCQRGKVRFTMGYSNLSFQEIDPLDASAAVAVYVENLKKTVQKRLNKSVDFDYKIFSSFSEMKQAIKENKVDLCSLSASEYYELKKELPIYPYLAIIVTENIYDQYCLLSYNGSGINSIKNLGGKTLSIPSPNSHVLMEEWLNTVLSENNLVSPREIFKEIKICDKESNAVYSVFFKNADVAIARKSVFNTLCELNPQIRNSLKIIKSSPPIVLIITAANHNSDQELLKFVHEEAREMSNSIGGKNILRIFKGKSFVGITERELQSSKEIIDKNNEIIKKISVQSIKELSLYR